MTLEPLAAEHATALFAVLADAELWRYTDDTPPASAAALRARYRKLETRRSPDGREHWLNWVIDCGRDGIAGFVQATVDEARASASVGYAVARARWSLGIGSEAVGAMIGFLHARFPGITVRATVDARNAASLRLLEKLSFAVEDAANPRSIVLRLPPCGPATADR